MAGSRRKKCAAPRVYLDGKRIRAYGPKVWLARCHDANVRDVDFRAVFRLYRIHDNRNVDGPTPSRCSLFLVQPSVGDVRGCAGPGPSSVSDIRTFSVPGRSKGVPERKSLPFCRFSLAKFDARSAMRGLPVVKSRSGILSTTPVRLEHRNTDTCP